MAQPWEQVLYSTPEEARLKRRLKFHFLNPWEKYEATGRLPWKLLLQILKVFLGIWRVFSSDLWLGFSCFFRSDPYQDLNNLKPGQAST
jgi:hypothetical protein